MLKNPKKENMVLRPTRQTKKACICFYGQPSIEQDTKEFTANFLLDSSTYTGLFSSMKPAKAFAQDPESTEY